MARALKVFRTAIGFHDAYIAAPSRKAALAAWGSTADLFARGVAEEVSDTALMAEPLARPGEVVRRSRGTLDEQLAALPPDRPQAKAAASTKAGKPKTKKPPTPRPQPPSRAELDRADATLKAAERRHADERADLDRRERALRDERAEVDRRQRTELDDLRRAERAADESYRRKLAAWQAADS